MFRRSVVFISKDKGSIKLLHWEKDGFVIYYKRLEKGTFTAPENVLNGVLQWPELVYMIVGLEAEALVRFAELRWAGF